MHPTRPVYRLLSHIVVLALLAQSISAHTLFVRLTLDGQPQDVGKCIKPYWSQGNGPVNDVSSSDMMCRTSDMNWASTEVCPVAAGSKISVEWNRKKQGTADVISASHTGPCLVYMARAETNGEGNAWFKIYEEGYDSSTKQWCTDKLIANKGILDVTIPADLKAGNYLLRTELIGLHGARREGQCQFFPNCAQLQVTGGANAVPDGVALPGYYKPDDPGILYARKSDNSGYIIPGPPVYKGGGGSAPNSPASSEVSKPSEATESFKSSEPSKSSELPKSPEASKSSSSNSTSGSAFGNTLPLQSSAASCSKKKSSRSSKSRRRKRSNKKVHA